MSIKAGRFGWGLLLWPTDLRLFNKMFTRNGRCPVECLRGECFASNVECLRRLKDARQSARPAAQVTWLLSPVAYSPMGCLLGIKDAQ